MNEPKTSPVKQMEQFWNKQSPEHKKRWYILALVIGVVVIGLASHSRGEKKKPAVAEKPEELQSLRLDPTMIEEEERAMLEMEMAQRDREIEAMGKTIGALEGVVERLERNSGEAGKKGGRVKPRPEEDLPIRVYDPRGSYPQPPARGRTVADRGGRSAKKAEEKEQGPVYIGDIANIRGDDGGAGKGAAPPPAPEKKKRGFLLSPGFMEGRLLSGMAAKIDQSGRDNPKSMLVRVQAPAVLPNNVRAHLTGCFVVVDGFGDLATERVETRLVSLSCLARGGSAVIDTKLKGTLIDEDGKHGLAGRVVSKMGAVLARSLVAGFIEGFGDAVRQGSGDLSVSPLGTTRSFDTGQAVTSGIGQGVGDTANDLGKFYLDLARQAMPIVESGAARKVTVFVKEKVFLEVKPACGEEGGCETLEG